MDDIRAVVAIGKKVLTFFFLEIPDINVTDFVISTFIDIGSSFSVS